MTTMEEANPACLSEGQASWHNAGQLLKAGQYERVAELLHEAQVASRQAGDAILADILAAAHQICRACTQHQGEVEWHRRAHDEAGRRERELEEQLHAILDLVGEYGGRQTGDKRKKSSPIRTAELNPPQSNAPEFVERFSPWQRMQSLLGRGPRPRSPGPKVSAKSAEAQAPVPTQKAGEGDLPSLTLYCLGPFRIYLDDKLINNWSGGKGKAIFKYMVAKRGRPVAKDILMDVFWRNADPEAARNNLNVAIYGLRQAFRAIRPEFSSILFQDDHYLLNPAMPVWVDLEQFVQRYEAGQRLERKGKFAEALSEYEIAESLYQGDFLEEDLYEDWPIQQRESLRDSYLLILDRLSRHYLEEKRYTTCIQLCHKILAKDNCREDIHRRLMRCYSRQGQRNLSVRQYHLCVEALARVLEVSPMQETVALYQQIRNGDVVDV